MAQRASFRVEHLLYACIFLLALSFRLINLGASPLSEYEATSALRAYQISVGELPDLGEQSAYVLLTSTLFALLPSSEFLARLWPALFGIALVLLPYFWSDVLGRRPALILALGLAIDPAMVAVSRLASGHMLAVSSGLFALTAWRHKLPIVAGILGAIALLSAPTLYIGLLGIILASYLSTRSKRQHDLRNVALAGGVTLLIGGTLFGFVPQGLSGAGNVFSAFLQGWRQPSGVLIGEVLFALAGYGFPVVLFGLIGAARAWTQSLPFGRVLGFFALISLVLIVLYPGRQVADLLWVLLPLWALTAMEVSHYLYVPDEDRAAALGTTALILLLGVFLTLTLAKLSFDQAGSPTYSNLFLVAGGVVLLGALAIALIAFGWSRQAASNGLVWGLVALFVLGFVTASLRFARPGAALANELWSPGLAAGQSLVLLSELDKLSAIDQGQPRALPVGLRVESTALAWALRDWPSASANQVETVPDVYITLTTIDQPEETSSYRGQSFALSAQRTWINVPPNIFSWLLFRQAPTLNQEAILWVRIDLFPDVDLYLQQPSDAGGTTP